MENNNDNGANESQEGREKIAYVPVVGVQLSHENKNNWFAQAHLERSILPSPPESGGQNGDDEQPGKLWWGLQLGKRF